MDPEQLTPEMMQMIQSLGQQGPIQATAPPPGADFGGMLPGLAEQTPSLGNEGMPLVPPPAMDGNGFMGGDMGAVPAGDPGMINPEVAQMVSALQGGGGGAEMGGEMSGLDPGLQPIPDAGMTGQWAPGTGQVPDLNQITAPTGNANNTSW